MPPWIRCRTSRKRNQSYPESSFHSHYKLKSCIPLWHSISYKKGLSCRQHDQWNGKHMCSVIVHSRNRQTDRHLLFQLTSKTIFQVWLGRGPTVYRLETRRSAHYAISMVTGSRIEPCLPALITLARCSFPLLVGRKMLIANLYWFTNLGNGLYVLGKNWIAERGEWKKTWPDPYSSTNAVDYSRRQRWLFEALEAAAFSIYTTLWMQRNSEHLQFFFS